MVLGQLLASISQINQEKVFFQLKWHGKLRVCNFCTEGLARNSRSSACLAADNSPMCTNESALVALASSTLSRLRDLNDRDADQADTS